MDLLPTDIRVKLWDGMCIAKLTNALAPAKVNLVVDTMLIAK